MRYISLTFGLWTVLVAATARADVFEIGVAGTVIVRAGDQIAVGERDPIVWGAAVPPAAVTFVESPAVPPPFRSALARAAGTSRVSPNLLAALVWQESRWHATALSPKGARGLTQLMPGTARALAVDPDDSAANLVGGARYLRAMLDMFDGNVERALAAYNAGPGRVLRSAGLPAIAENRAYVSAIIDHLSDNASGARRGTMLEGMKP